MKRMLNKAFWRKILVIMLWMIFSGGFLTIVGFVEKEQKQIRCKGLDIKIDLDEAEAFITPDDVRKVIRAVHGDSITAMNLKDISIEKIRKGLMANPYAGRVYIFVTVDGIMKISIRQRKPILRVYNVHGEHFYLTLDGHMVPTSAVASARVPLANGLIAERFDPDRDLRPVAAFSSDNISERITPLQKCYLLAGYLGEQAFFNAFIEEIYYNRYGEFEFIPKTASHIILFGDINDFEEKFEKLRVFYNEGLRNKGWSSYGTINLMYRNQVVCSKNKSI